MSSTGDTPIWRKSSRCVADNCLEVAVHEGRVLLRSTADPGRTVLECTTGEWREFAQAVRRGEFDAP
jgi:hypothetical protein